MRGGRTCVAVLTLAAVALLAGCGDDEPSDSADTDVAASPTPSATPPSPTPPSTDPTPTTDPAPVTPTEPSTPPTEDPMPEHGPLAAAIADLSRDTGVAPDDIEVVANEQVTWRDGSLGCPKPGMMYTQALVDGYRIVLRAAGAEVAYHGANGQAPLRCDHPNPHGAIDG